MLPATALAHPYPKPCVVYRKPSALHVTCAHPLPLKYHTSILSVLSCVEMRINFPPDSCHSSARYKWLIITAGCITMFLRAIFINGTLPILSIYYEQNFSDRKLSSMIGSVQMATSYIGGELTVYCTSSNI